MWFFTSKKLQNVNKIPGFYNNSRMAQDHKLEVLSHDFETQFPVHCDSGGIIRFHIQANVVNMLGERLA